ncbi:protein LEAD-SENSITIVE 1-like [Bidens hawaiensis]|uniref:protein LEAD-SENSITIVE 1-like n=1 Tax=Bidens hawaiensis TaxID=980011 RepID=UPI00404B1383
MDLLSKDLLSQKIERSELEQGDHIYSWRKPGYTHHGIYIGEDKIIHFVRSKKKAGGDLLSNFRGFTTSSGGDGEKTHCSTSFCKLEKVAESGVKLSCIDCFLKKGSLCRFKYQVSREFLLAKMVAGTCTTAESDPPEEVIHRATYLYENGYVKYHQMDNNCEDFALYCKTGLWSKDTRYQGRSSQANMIHRTSHDKKDADWGERIHRCATAIPRTFLKRENKDLGIRQDVEKVPVEKLSSFCASLK